MKKWRSEPLFVVDTETTGLDWTTDEIFELAIIPMVPNLSPNGSAFEILEGSSVLILPSKKIPVDVEILTGITNEYLKEEKLVFPNFVEAVTTLFMRIELQLGEPQTLSSFDFQGNFAAYNAPFDHHMLACMFLRSNLEVPKWLLSNSLKPNWLDPYVWAQTFEPYAKGQGRYKQGAVAERLGIFPEKSHRALDDARVCAKIINEFSRKEGLLPEKWDDLIAIQRMNSAKQEYEILKFLNSKKE